MKAIKKVIRLLLALAAIMLIFCWWNSPQQIYIRNKDKLNAAVQSILESGYKRGTDVEGVGELNYLRNYDDPVISLKTSSFGVIPAAPYVGLYYSANGCPVADEAGATLVKNGSIWKWTGTGDNRGKTWNIDGNWYGYTAWY